MKRYGYEYKDEILETYKLYNTILHIQTDKGFEYLDDNSYCIEIINETGKNLFIDLEADITISFSGWHCHYNVYDYDSITLLKSDIKNILNNKTCIMNAFCDGQQLGSINYSGVITPEADKQTLLKQFKYIGKTNLRKLTVRHGTIKVAYWDSTRNFEIQY